MSSRQIEFNLFNYSRRNTVEVNVGGVSIGCDHPVRVQSMTNTDTHDIDATYKQTLALAEAGCDIVRITAPDVESVKTFSELKRRGITYRGILYAGLMVNDENSTPRGPVAKSGSSVNVVEFNARFGDPETEAVLPRLGGSFATMLLHAAEGRLEESDVVVKDDCCATIIASSAGYPGNYEKGKKISGLEEEVERTVVFHCGTAFSGADTITSGGRVLSITGSGKTLREAVDAAYGRISGISFEGMFFRKDIAHRAFDRGSVGRA